MKLADLFNVLSLTSDPAILKLAHDIPLTDFTSLETVRTDLVDFNSALLSVANCYPDIAILRSLHDKIGTLFVIPPTMNSAFSDALAELKTRTFATAEEAEVAATIYFKEKFGASNLSPFFQLLVRILTLLLTSGIL